MRSPLFGGLGLMALTGLCSVGCGNYNEPAPATEAKPVVSGPEAALARGGIDMRYAGHGRDQRSTASGVTTDTDDNRHIGMQMGIGGAGQSPTSTGMEDPRETASIGENPAENSQGRHRGMSWIGVYHPSDHVFVDGMDMGPSRQRLYGTQTAQSERAL